MKPSEEMMPTAESELKRISRLADEEFICELRRLEDEHPEYASDHNWSPEREVMRRLLLKPFTLAKPIVFVAGKAAFDPDTLNQLRSGGYCVLRCKQEDVEFIKEMKEMEK